MLFIFNETTEKNINFYHKEMVKYKDCLLSSVSHDLRTPLNSIIFISGIILPIFKFLINQKDLIERSENNLEKFKT